MADWWEWTGEPGPWESNAAPDLWAGGSPTFNEGGGYSAPIGPGLGWDVGGYPMGAAGSGLSLEEQVAQAIAQRPDLYGESVSSGAGGGGNWLQQLLSGGGQALSSLFGQGGAGGPLLSALGSLGGGVIGSNAANEAARLQSQALNRGIDLQTAQWLQQQQNLAPYLQAGQGGLAQLQQLAGREQPQLPGVPGMLYGEQYQMPGTTPGWTPQPYQGPQGPNAGDYRWTPGQGPQAQDYRYTPGQTPDAAAYRYTPGAVPTLSGQELLANDPGVTFRMAEGRKALEASAAARGGLLSGPTLAALQRQGQELSSQEYGQAWNRASQQAQLREQWGQQASQMGFGQAEAAARLREQVSQIASQQGWSQAQAEAAFREQMGQLASQQGWNQALAGQQNQFGQGLQAQQWNQQQAQQYQQEMYNRQAQQAQQRYAQDLTAQNTAYDRQQAQYRQQLAQHLLPWEQASTLANLGGQATSMYGTQGGTASRGISDLLAQLGTAQGTAPAASGLSWQRALTGATNQVRPLLSALNA